MAGVPKVSNVGALAGTEGDDFDGSELGFGELEEEELPADGEVQAAADDGSEERELDPSEEEGEEQAGAEEGDGEEVEYEEDDEEEQPAPIVPPPGEQPQPQINANQPAASGAREERTPVLHELLAANEKVLAEKLAKGPFALSGEDADLFEDDGLKHFIAKNNATVFIRTMTAVSQLLHASLPAAVENLTRVNSDVQKHENEFYKEYSDLSPIKDKLPRIMAFVMEQNPGINRKALAAETARVARAVHGITPPKGGAPSIAANGKPRIKTLSRVPFTPAGKGAAPRPANGKGQKREDPLFALNRMLASDSDE